MMTFFAIVGMVTCLVFVVVVLLLLYVAWRTRGEDEPPESTLI
jgi:hypothetical protein